MFEVIEVEHHIGLSAKVAIESIESDSHDITVMYFAPPGNTADLNPKLVNQIYIIFRQMRGVGSQIYHVLCPAGLDDFETNLTPRLLGQTFPRAAKLTRLLLSGHLRRKPCYHHLRIQSPGGLRDGVEDVGCRNDHQIYWSPVFFREGHDSCKQTPLVVGKQSLVMQIALAASRTGHQARRYYDDVLGIGICAGEHVLKMRERIVIANRNQNVSRTRADSFKINRLVVLKLKLIELGERHVELSRVDTFRDREDCKEGKSECDP